MSTHCPIRSRRQNQRGTTGPRYPLPLCLVILTLLFAAGAGCPNPPVYEEGWIPTPSGAVWATYQIRGDRAVLDDMTFKLDYLREFQTQDALQPGPNGGVFQANVQLCCLKSWSDSDWVVPYVIDPSVEQDDLEIAIQPAINHYNEQTLVRFVPLHLAENQDDYIRILEEDNIREGVAGLSDLGRQGGEQRVRISPQALKDTVMHELGHALGSMHEHQRLDRDDYVEVVRDNISLVEDLFDVAFTKWGTAWGDYDYGSIMHYSNSQGSIEGRPTMIARRPGNGLPIPQDVMGARRSLSKLDVAAVNSRVLGQTTYTGKEAYNALSVLALEGIAPNADQHRVGDFNGDGLDDLAAFMLGDGSVFVSLGQPDGTFAPDHYWHPTGLCFQDDFCEVGDFDGDGDDDVVRVRARQITIANSDGETGFYTSGVPQEHFVLTFADGLAAADVNGDCRDDLVVIDPRSDYTWVRVFLSQPGGFVRQLDQKLPGIIDVQLADVDGDRLDDIVAFPADGPVDTWSYTPDGLVYTGITADEVCVGAQSCMLYDMDNDRRADLVAFNPDAEHYLDRVRIAFSTGYEFADFVPNFHEFDCRHADGCLLGDVDGNGLGDVIDPIANGDGDTKNDDLGRIAGRTYVSLATAFLPGTPYFTEDIGPKKPIPYWAYLPQACATNPDVGQ